MDNRVNAILKTAARQIQPTSLERRRAKQTFESIKDRIAAKAKRLGLNVRVEEVGSVGKDTWIRGEADLDAFIIFPEETKRADLEKYGLELGRYASRGDFIVAYAEHPYTRAEVNGLEVDIVPCVGVKDPSRIITAVDRTPFHRQFVIDRLNRKLRSDIRLLKRFMMTVGVYGAELKVRGFSGYLAELLAIHYGGFLETLRAASDWEEGVVIDIRGSYRQYEDARLVFEDDPLIVIDPVDRRRNVAAAVNREKMAVFVSSAREFLKAPSALFFKDPVERPSMGAMMKLVGRANLPLLALQTACPKLVPDILWGQLHKSLSGLDTLLERHGFKVVYSDAWTDQVSVVIFLFELESLSLSQGAVHQGPGVYMKKEAERFVQKHLGSGRVLAGPWIAGNRWSIEERRPITEAATLLKARIGEARLGADIGMVTQKRIRIATGEDAVRLAKQKSYAVFLNRFLRRRPIWLEWRSKERTKNS